MIRTFFILLCFVFTSTLVGQEEILNYDVEIHITESNRIKVKETIRVRAEGNLIRRGIFRSIPIIRPDENGNNEPAPIDIISVKKNGKQEEYHIEKNRQQLVVYMGNEDELIEPGIYTYELQYNAKNQIGFFDEYDELYWNVIGHEWSFPVLNHSAVIYLPEGAEYLQGACYTGSVRSTMSDCTLSLNADGAIVLQGNRKLSAYEGSTVSVAWPKGFVSNEFSRQLDLNYINILLFVGGMVIFLFYGYHWWQKVGKDPPLLPTVPDWNPPEGYSPAEVSYLYKRSITGTAITAALVNAAIKGVIRIENKKKKFTLHRLNASDVLEPEEASIVDALMPGSASFEIKRSNYTRYQAAKDSFHRTLKRKMNIQEYFQPNWREVVKGSLLMTVITTLALCAGMYPLQTSYVLAILWTMAMILVVFILVSIPFRILKWYKWLIVVPVWIISCTVFVLVFSEALFFTFSYAWVAFMVGLSSFLVGFFNYLIYAPTEKGQESASQVKGFRMYLNTSEKKMLEYFTPPEKTPELFEKMLPFAIALGVENKWGKKFKQVLDEAIERGSYAPVWYTGNMHQINSLHSNFQSSVSHAAPKSSSGSGGGGFSGGGGGGGGGGGW